jgi:hypothetical protein
MRIPLNMKPGVNAPLGNPLNAILSPSLLTESGLVVRRRTALALLAFVLMIAVAALAGGLATVLAP